MKTIIGGRGSGRTWKLLQEASKENGLVVCHSKSSAEYTKDMAINMYRKGDLKSVPEIVWVGELVGNKSENRGHTNKISKKLFIDNTEFVLEEMFHGEVGKFVVCDKEEKFRVNIYSHDTNMKAEKYVYDKLIDVKW